MSGCARKPARHAGRPDRSHDIFFYDGSCGLCHRAVRLALGLDPDGSRFRYAPVGGETFNRLLPARVRAGLPDSLVLLSHHGAVFVRSRAVLEIMRRAGPMPRAVAWMAGMIPAPVLDLLYDRVAAARNRLFARPAGACPVVSAALRARFDL